MNGEIPGRNILSLVRIFRGWRGGGVERGRGGAGGSPGMSLMGGSSPKGILREPALLSNGVMSIKK